MLYSKFVRTTISKKVEGHQVFELAVASINELAFWQTGQFTN
jgi:hypothetical protein